MKDKHKNILFNQRRNKTFNPRLRFSQENKEDSSSEENSKEKDFVSKWRRDKDNNKRKVGFGMSMRTLILVLVLLLICMVWLESKIN